MYCDVEHVFSLIIQIIFTIILKTVAVAKIIDKAK